MQRIHVIREPAWAGSRVVIRVLDESAAAPVGTLTPAGLSSLSEARAWLNAQGVKVNTQQLCEAEFATLWDLLPSPRLPLWAELTDDVRAQARAQYNKSILPKRSR